MSSSSSVSTISSNDSECDQDQCPQSQNLGESKEYVSESRREGEGEEKDKSDGSAVNEVQSKEGRCEENGAGFYRETNNEDTNPSSDSNDNSTGNSTDRKNLIVNYLPQQFSNIELADLFAAFGEMESCRIMFDKKTGYTFGFGFVNYVHEESAAEAIKERNGYQIENTNKRIKVSYARPSSEEIKDTNLYITNLPRDINEEGLEDLFSSFGEIVQKNILRDKITGLPRGVGFVRYSRRDQAENALRSMNNYYPSGAIEPIVVKRAVDHGRQKASYLAGYRAGLRNGDNQHSQEHQHSRQQPRSRYPPQSSIPAQSNSNSTHEGVPLGQCSQW